MDRTRERSWLGLVGDLLSAPLTELPDERIAAQLHASFGLLAAAYNYREPGRGAVQRVWPRGEQFCGHRAEVDHWGACCVPACHPILRYYLATGDWRAIQVADVPARFADEAAQASWREVAVSWGVPSQLALPLHVGQHSHRAFVLGRADPFTPDEVQLALTVQHLLRGLDRQVVAARTGFGGGARDVATSMHLTPRELAVLGELADGLTAAAIGRKLLITERTVHKHLERLYTKLGVGDRLAAVLQAQRLGLLPVR
ncbi:regulatory LuxR family protein [Pseudonocardia hierapolitana]|uniref:Regulatory LuxR family protein n=1 Tax=Pseudonocardia hierapolitana TaxID=1128676 RepID=A0A561SNL9_9PSEU|nr:LuxR C-terminal-related transcriptional regulator [Pseudonocardia hierapolitana]TWF76463.1 regulatory LuxR family protein [Pseudonocardia hierapolitana]